MDQALGKKYTFESKAKCVKEKCVKCFNNNVNIATNTYSALENLHHENKILSSIKRKSDEQIGERLLNVLTKEQDFRKF